MIVPDGKWIEFAPLPRQTDRKTDVWLVIAKDGGAPLGEVRWYGRWRQYSFFPRAECVFERQCLTDLARFLEQQTTLQRLSRTTT